MADIILLNGSNQALLGWRTLKETFQIMGRVFFPLNGVGLELEELKIISVAVFLVLLVFIFQVRRWIKDLKQDNNKILLRVLTNLLLDVFLLFFIVALQLVFSSYLERHYRPSEVSYVRVAPDLAEISWRTREACLSTLIWGTDPDHLQYYVLGKSGSQKTNDHQILLNAEPKQAVHFAIVYQGEIYGDENGLPYELGSQADYQLELIEPVQFQVEEVTEPNLVTASAQPHAATPSGKNKATESGEIVE